MKIFSASFVTFFFIAIISLSLVSFAQVTQTKEQELSSLLKSELELDLNENQLSSLSPAVKDQMIAFFAFVRQGRLLYAGKTQSEQIFSGIASMVESEMPKSLKDVSEKTKWQLINGYLNYIAKEAGDKIGAGSEQSLIGLSNNLIQAGKLSLDVAGLLIGRDKQAEENVVFFYINYRNSGKTDEEAWQKFSEEEAAINNLSEGFKCDNNKAIPQCAMFIALHENDIENGNNLRKYARKTYEAQKIAQQINTDPKLKESLKQWVNSEIEKANELKIEQPKTGIISGIFQKIAETLQSIYNGIISVIGSAANYVTSKITKGDNIPTNPQPASIIGGIEKLTEKNKNPFQDLYDYYPQGGKFQECVKSNLGDKFSLVYNGDYISEDVKITLQKCAGTGSIGNFYEILPLEAGNCIKDALGSDFEKALKNPSYQNSEAEKKIISCPAFQEFFSKAETLQKNLEKYIEDKKPLAPVNPNVSLAWFEIREFKNGEFMPTTLTSKHLKEAWAESNKFTGGFDVRLSLLLEGKQLFKEITARNIGNKIAIYIDNVSISAPIVQGIITDGEIVINGGTYSKEESELLAERLNAGRGSQSNPNPNKTSPIPNDNPVANNGNKYQPPTDEEIKIFDKLAETKLVVIETSKGIIKFKFYPKDAPMTVANFIKLANAKFYDGLTFHRVTPEFLIQSGDPSGTGLGDSGYKIKAEFNSQKFIAGTVAMSRSWNPDIPDSASSQFYITLASQPQLNGKDTVFGQVVQGMDVIKQIQKGDIMNKVYIAE